MRWLGAIVVSALLLIGCKLTASAPTTPLAEDADVGGPRPSAASPLAASPSPAPSASDSLDAGLEPISILQDRSRGYILAIKTNKFKGTAYGPADLVGNSGVSLVGNSGVSLVGNSGVSLVGNSGVSLVGNSGVSSLAARGRYQIGALSTSGVADAFVYATTLGEQFYVNKKGRLFAALTNEDGSFDLEAPATESVVISVLLNGDRRLTSMTDLTRSGTTIRVDLATTLVTEFVRAKAAQLDFTLADVFANAAAAASYVRLVTLTGELLQADPGIGALQPADLTIGRIGYLRQRYVVAFGTGSDRRLSDEWVTFLRAVKRDPDGADARYRPLAITVFSKLPEGDFAMDIAADASGAVYVSESPRDGTRKFVLGFKPDGTGRHKLVEYDPARYADITSITAGPDGFAFFSQGSNVGCFDVARAAKGGYASSDVDLVQRLEVLVDNGIARFLASTDTISDLAVSDGASPSLFVANRSKPVVWSLPAECSSAGGNLPKAPFAGSSDEPGSVLEGIAPLASLRFAYFPRSLAFQRSGAGRGANLYVADSYPYVDRIDLSGRTAERFAGARWSSIPRNVCSSPSDEGADPLGVLLGVTDVVADDRNHVFLLANRDEIKVVDRSGSRPALWTIAGLPEANGDCFPGATAPPFGDGEGEARTVTLGGLDRAAIDPDGNLLLADTGSNLIRKVWTSFLR